MLQVTDYIKEMKWIPMNMDYNTLILIDDIQLNTHQEKKKKKARRLCLDIHGSARSSS